MTRLPVTKTYKLFIGGKFPRTESGRSLAVKDREGNVLAHICHASRKDLREAVEASRAGHGRWSGATAYNRGQVIYRMAEMLEGAREDFAAVIASTVTGGLRGARKEVDAVIDRLVCFAGWADKFAQVLGCQNPVAGPYYNFTIPEPTGVVAVVCPDEPPLLGLVSMLAPPLCAGNGVIVIASQRHPLPAALLGEICATSDVPPGVINILTGKRRELLEPLAAHREVNAVLAANLKPDDATMLQTGAAENVKRVHLVKRTTAKWFEDDLDAPWAIEPAVEMKTIWHPSGA
ncbi:MAG: aldehyde dehydrogenase family protein [Planctomycetota bacterium]|jgi:acyl-CoA reductase-like NAD-dependent aldehyde dehydrogenase